jgi:hypothetical protein
MRDPTAIPDPNGEWFEIVNVSGETHQLMNCVFHDDGVDTFTIDADLTIAPGEFLVFARTINPGFVPDFVYNSMTLGNGSDDIELECNALTVDIVAWDGTFPAPVGAAIQLDPAAQDDLANDDGGNWCAAGSAYFMGDLGTPGAINSGC